LLLKQLKIDFGGGLKSDADLKIAFDSGANQITGGSIAIKNRALFENGFKNTVLIKLYLVHNNEKWPYQGGWKNPMKT
jgi:phosphoribosylformimino-5-aminoimidazole carboxamide ribotide isomerase